MSNESSNEHFKDSGMVVKLPRARVDELIAQGTGTPFAPAGKVFREWVSIPRRDRRRWRSLLREGVAFSLHDPSTSDRATGTWVTLAAGRRAAIHSWFDRQVADHAMPGMGG